MNIWVIGIALALVLSGGYAYVSLQDGMDPVLPGTGESSVRDVVQDSEEGVPAAGQDATADMTFTGTLEEVHEGCYVDAECYVVVDGKHVTVMMGWRNEVAGSVQGVSDFGALTGRLGAQMEVYARENGEDRYTLYGNKDFYIRVMK